MSDRFERYIRGDQPAPEVEEATETPDTDLVGRPPLPKGQSYLYSELEVELSHLLNRHSAENESGTPDYILAEYLVNCLRAFESTVQRRAIWRGEHTELPALQRSMDGKRTVPMVVTSPNGRMMNDIGEAEIKITPGEQVLIGRIEKVVAIFEPDEDSDG